MVTMFDEEAARSRSHGLRPEVLAAQRSGCWALDLTVDDASRA